jgi:hypothetical protein
MDKARIRRLADELNRKIGFVPDPEATAERTQAMMRASGMDPESREFSQGIIHAREARLAPGAED